MTEQTAKVRKSINYLIRTLIILLTYGFIYHQVAVENKFRNISDSVSGVMERKNAWLLPALMLAMMLLNWSLESLKWKILIARIEKLSFIRSFKAVMTGVSVSLFMPNRTGDYLGRVFILEKGNHIEGIFSTLIGSFAQITVTFSVGLFCLLSFVDQYIRIHYRIGEYLFMSLIFIVPCLVFVMILIYFKVGLLADFITRFFPGKWEKLKQYTGVFSKYNNRELGTVLAYSFLRYAVFSTQFYLLLRFFGADIPAAEGFILIPVIYLAMALVPTVALVELGVRGSVSMYIVGLYFEKAGISGSEILLAPLAASSFLWLINLVLPAVIGTFFVFNLKFLRK